MMASEANGYYAAYFAGSDGEGLGVIILNNGILTGVDVIGTTFDGSYVKDDETKHYNGVVVVKAPAGGKLIQGKETGVNGLSYSTHFSLPPNFVEQPFIALNTEFGLVHVKLTKLRDL